ncbi:recombinase family protein [Candidatus Dependentiae bacterium]
MEKVVIYARVSSKDQEAEGFSIPSQLKLLREYATKNNYIIVKEFTNVEAASKAGRKMFNEMLTFVEENNNIKHILVEKTDWLLRNITDYSRIDELIRDFDVKIHLVKENVELSRDSKSNEKFMFGIKALMAKNFTDNLSEEVCFADARDEFSNLFCLKKGRQDYRGFFLNF